MTNRVRVVSFGVGVIGALVAKTIMESKQWIDIVGAIDVDPNKVGKDLGTLLGLSKSGVLVSNNVEKVLKETKPDIVIHTTSSFFEKTFPELKQIAECKIDIISSCEELSYPYVVNQKLAKDLDTIARQNEVTILGTGINPGFLMDVLPIVLSAPCLEIESMHVARQMDAAKRRIPFQKKIGAGMEEKEFRSAIRSGAISGHVGLKQSIAMLSDSIGWKLDDIVIGEPEPVILDESVKSDWITIAPGKVAGTKQVATGIVGGKPRIQYDFLAYIGAKEEFDLVEITGNPRVSFRSNPCVNGDAGTIAMLVNMIPKVINSSPGLVTMKDLPIPSAVNVR